MNLKKYKLEDLKKSISSSLSLRETLNKLGVRPHGGNYEVLRKAIKFFQLDVSHFKGQGHSKGKTHNYNTRKINEILVYGKYENTHRLRIRLIKEGLKGKECENCKNFTWQDREIPLELHHKDGNRMNNTIENIQLLCPNCHALTENYRGKNKN
jgi:hypothetical protein